MNKDKDRTSNII